MSTVPDQRPNLLEANDEMMTRSHHTTEVMRRVAAELSRLTDLIFAMELALPSILEGRANRMEAKSLIALQQLDRVAQTLTALSIFLTRLEPERPDDSLHIGSALTSVFLADLVERLGASETTVGETHLPDPSSSSDSGSGTIELFQLEGH